MDSRADIQSPITVLLVDNHPIAREGIRAILTKSPDIQVVGEAEDKSQLVKLVAELHPKILLLDVEMPGSTLAQFERLITINLPKTITLILTNHDCDACLARMMDAGAVGYLFKTENLENLISGIRQAVCGNNLFTAEQFVRANHWRLEAGRKWENLTNREQQIIGLMVEGCDNKCVAQILSISTKTVAYHVSNILKKLELKTRQEVMAWAYKFMSHNLEKLLG